MITSSDAISKNLSLFAALVLIVLGLINVVPKRRDGLALGKLKNSGWRRGILMGILNPLAIPYWVGITAYLRSQGWINLSTSTGLHLYLCGIVVGAFLLLALLAYLSKKVMQSFQQYPWIQKIPGYLLLVLGLYSLIVYLS